MDIIRTKVFAKVERAVALEVLLADRRRGLPILFAMVDRVGGKISGCERAGKRLSGQLCEGRHAGQPCLSNFAEGYRAMSEKDIDVCVNGFAKSLPCEFGWIMSVDDHAAFLAEFGSSVRKVDQNTFLPATARAFAFGGVWATMAIDVKTLHLDHSLSEISGDDAQQPFKTKSWSFIHFWLNRHEQTKITSLSKGVERDVEPHVQALVNSVQSRGIETMSSLYAPRVTLSGPVRKWLKMLGYTRNKAASEPRLTVFDKPTLRGNLIRIDADAGGHGDLIPYIEICVQGAGFQSPRLTIVKPDCITTDESLTALLEQHGDDVRYFEKHIAPAYDNALGDCHPTVTRLMREQQIRQVR
ncbi:MAG: hypothetical protein WD768_10660 [Phycisphaeraceae bacterium]